MVRCIVKSCKNKTTGVREETVNFFQLPKNEVMREGWLKKIGDYVLPPKVEFARICSVHFSQESFHQGRARKDPVKKRHLLPSAVPTLFLNCSEARNINKNVMANPNLNQTFNVLRREFPLVVNSERRIESSNTTSPTTSHVVVEDNIVNISTPKGIRRRSDWLDANVDIEENLPVASGPEGRVCNSTPRRSVARRHDSSKNTPHLTRLAKNKHRRQSSSDPLSPAWKRRKRFLMNNCTGQTSQKKATHLHVADDVDAELRHRRSLSNFFKKSLCDASAAVTSIEQECAELKMKLKAKTEEQSLFIKEIEDLKEIVDRLKKQLQEAEVEKERMSCAKEEYVREVLSPYFTAGQIRCILEKRKWIHWSIEDYAAAISLRSISPKAYRYLTLKLNFPFPSLSSLRRWALRGLDTSEGYLHDVLRLMNEKGKDLSTLQKVVVMSFDEMALSSEECFDQKIEKLIGPCYKVQVIMVRGLFATWKQPIYYKYDQTMTKAIVMEGIELLHNAGYEVVAITSDLGNKGLWGELDITPDHHYFMHPSKKDAKIFVFADVPHMLKLLRNWFVDNGFHLSQCKDPFTVKVYQRIVDICSSGDLRIAHRLTQKIIDARNSSRQAVGPAAKLWSHTAAQAIEWSGDNGILKDFPEYKKYSKFVSIVNKWFDVHNSRSKYGSHAGVNGFGVDLEKQEMVLNLMSFYVQTMTVGDRKTLMPFQKGIIVSNNSLQELHNYLKLRYPDDFQYIITRRLQQDILENFFSYIRGMGATRDHPSGYEFRHRLRWYILGKHSHAVFTMHKNTEEDLDASCMSSGAFGDTHAVTPSTSMQSVLPRQTSTPQKVCLSEQSKDTFDTSLQSTCAHTFKDDSTVTSDLPHIDEDEIVLTKELFTEIINISPADLDADEKDDAFAQDNFQSEKEDEEEKEIQNFIHQYFDDCDTASSASELVQEAGLQYIAGYVAHRFKHKYANLGDHTSNIGDEIKTSWVMAVSKGYLMYPSVALLNAAKILEKCFIAFHGHHFSKEDYVIRKVMKLVKEDAEYKVSLPDEVLLCLVRTRTYIRIKENAKKSYANRERRKKEKKMKKLVS